MRRREFVTLLGGAAAAWPLAARAQERSGLRRIGVLLNASDDPVTQARLAVFRQALEKLGWTEGRNLRIDTRWAMGEAEGARAGAAELLALAPDAILVMPVVGLAALQRATHTVPIVFTVVSEPVAQGFVVSLARPGANITGFSNLEPSIGGKWLQLLKEIAPQVSRVTVMGNPETAPFNVAFAQAAETVARSLAVNVTSAAVRARSDIETVLTMLGREPGGGLIINTDTFNFANRDLIVALATRQRVPAIYPDREFVSAGGLASYGINQIEVYRQAAGYVDRILRGEQPAS
jgi:putative ABC transport system substrate-binding protein